MKLISLKFKKTKDLVCCVEEKTLFTDIPTLGIAFTCIDNWCSDNGRNVVTMNDIEFNSDIVITTIKNNIATDEYDVIFKITKD